MKPRFPHQNRAARFRDRLEAGRLLAERLDAHKRTNALILGIPRGGVPVAAEIARRLDAELDVVVARKLGAPGRPELAIGAVTAQGGCFLNVADIARLDVAPAYLDEVIATERAEARRREDRFRGDRPPASIADRTVFVVDDGLATGATMRAAVRAVRAERPARIIIAVPVGARSACEELRADADEVICLQQPEPFYAVGLHYERFEATPDDEVQRLLHEAAERQEVTPTC